MAFLAPASAVLPSDKPARRRTSSQPTSFISLAAQFVTCLKFSSSDTKPIAQRWHHAPPATWNAQLARECLDPGLLDEIVINLVPVVLGDGIPLLASIRNGSRIPRSPWPLASPTCATA
jgi:hypothetical protein